MSDESLVSYQTAAHQLWQAEQSGLACPPVRELIGEDNIDAAYAVQQINIQRGLQAGRRLVGSKIGLTSPAVQQQLGVDQPDYGRLFADMAVCEGEEIALSRLMQPKIEAEIALVLQHDLPHEKHTIADLIRATAYVLPALEIVGSRIANWNIRLTDTIADNASSGLFVLGSRPVLMREVDWLNCGMVLECQGEPVSVGGGAACMGNPLYAALWLADTLARRGDALQAGDIILTGALGPMVPVQAGQVFSTRIQSVGEVSAQFAQA